MKTTSKIDKAEQKTFYEDDTQEVPPSDIVAYNESRSCADLYRMYTSGILNIQPEFQREIVWKGAEQTRFIDSLVKRLPIPSLCFSFDYKTNRWQTIDGLQRISTIIRFLSGDSNWTLSKLDDVDLNLCGKPARKFLEEGTKCADIYERIENLTLPITVLRCDYSKIGHTDYLFTIFHRLNTGGTKLNNQEIRNCIYAGSLNVFLKKMNAYPNWMKLNKMKKTEGYRFKKEELILRFFALSETYMEYGGRLAKFLNAYMNKHRNAPEGELLLKKKIFENTVDIALHKVFLNKAPVKVPLSIIEGVLVGIAANLSSVNRDTYTYDLAYQNMLEDEEYSESKLSEGLSGKERVIRRMDAAIKAFS